MIPKDNGARGPPIGAITPLDHDNGNNTPTQAILSVYKSYRDFSTITGRRHSSSTPPPLPPATATATAAAATPPPPPPPLQANDGFRPKNTTLCTLSIPSYMSILDFLNFVAPVDTFVSHYRVLCDGSPQSYLVLMTFRDEKVGHDYYKQYNKRKFSSMEDELCEIVYIKTITIMSATRLVGGTTTDDNQYPFFLSFLENDDAATGGGGMQNNCPVCLDPMDESVTGLLTTLCQHTFHVHCLTQWGDGSCPVCRYSQKPTIANDGSAPLPPTTSSQQKQQLFFMGTNHPFNTTEQQQQQQQQSDGFTNVCHDCGYTAHLWICLVCGQIGCGQEHEAHALAHYTATHHVYALDIDSQRVWDYAGDNYVHRLIQNAVDGKLVELSQPLQQQQQLVDASLSDTVQGKLNAMALEYSYLLTSQLDSQRMYYEDRINSTLDALAQLSDGCKQATRDLDRMHSEALEEDDNNQLAEQVEALRQHNTRLVHKVAQWKEKTKIMERNYLEEKELTRSISQNNALVKNDIEKVQRRLDVMAAKRAEWMACLEQDDSTPPSGGNDPSPSS